MASDSPTFRLATVVISIILDHSAMSLQISLGLDSAPRTHCSNKPTRHTSFPPGMSLVLDRPNRLPLVHCLPFVGSLPRTRGCRSFLLRKKSGALVLHHMHAPTIRVHMRLCNLITISTTYSTFGKSNRSPECCSLSALVIRHMRHALKTGMGNGNVVRGLTVLRVKIYPQSIMPSSLVIIQ